MKEGKCPKCGANEVYRFTNKHIGIVIKTGLLKWVHLSPYVCSQCGFTELFADNPGEVAEAPLGERVE